ncbi:MAG: carbohydrate-binding family 9-like protein [Pyrinomonadaceae bacterium]
MRSNRHIAAAVLALLAGAAAANAQTMSAPESIKIKHITKDFAIGALDNAAWSAASVVEVETYWSGRPAPRSRHFSVRMLWSDTSLYVRFEAGQHEPLVVSDRPDTSKKTLQLWDRDVCEIFIAPDRERPRRYFEFEVAPTGEWIDLSIEIAPDGKRTTDWDYASGMRSSARIEKNKVVMAMRVGWKALGREPKAGDIWLGNLFRCVGRDPDRGYLAWRPTLTEKPNFHVPEKFGEFVFED